LKQPSIWENIETARAENENEKQAPDFINQLNNLQFRYGIAVSKNILDGILEEVDFEDFRAYCVLGALNVYNAKNNKDKED